MNIKASCERKRWFRAELDSEIMDYLIKLIFLNDLEK